MAIILSSQFELNAQLALDSRTIKADVTARNAIVEEQRYFGLEVRLLSDGTKWVLLKASMGGVDNNVMNNANWIEVTGGGSTLTLQVNGTPNGDQTLLNLAPGTGMTVTDNGTGTVTFATTITQYTNELAQDAIGAMVDTTLVYVDATPLLTRAALTGDVTAPQGSNTTTIANDAVTYAKIQNVTSNRLLGRATAGSGDVEEIILGAGLSFSGTTLNSSGITGLPDPIKDNPGGLTGVNSVDYVLRRLYNTVGARILDWDIGMLYDSTPIASLSYETRIAYNTAGVGAVNWESQLLNVTNLVPGLDWSDSGTGTAWLNLESTGIRATLDLIAPGMTIAGLIYPVTDGSNGDVLTTDGAGNLTFQAPSGGSGVTGLTADTGGTTTGTTVTLAGANGLATIRSSNTITFSLGAITPTSVNSVVISGASTPTLAVTGTTTVSGANTGDQNLFSTFAVSGQSNVVADTTSDTVTFVGAGGITITTNAGTDTITFTGSGSGITGTDTHVLFFDGTNNPAGDAGFTYNKTTDTVTVVGDINVAGLLATKTGVTFEETGAGTDIITIQAATAIAAGFTLTLPTALPAGTAFVKSSATGDLSFDTSTYLTANQTISLSGDITGSGTTAITTTIANDAVTFAKFQNITTARLLGRATAGTGNMEEIILGTGLSFSGTTLNATGGTSIDLQTDGVSNTDQTVLNLISGTNITLTPDGVGGVTIDASGGGASLEVNGTPNGDQTLLNLAAGTNITLTDNGTGTVTIDAAPAAVPDPIGDGAGGGSGATSIDYRNRLLVSIGGNTVDYENKELLYPGIGAIVAWHSGLLNDSSAATTLNWFGRTLASPSLAATVLTWGTSNTHLLFRSADSTHSQLRLANGVVGGPASPLEGDVWYDNPGVATLNIYDGTTTHDLLFPYTNGVAVTITTARLTPVTGAQGSMTFTNGILTAQTQAT